MARMFEAAHDFTIHGSQFNNAETINNYHGEGPLDRIQRLLFVPNYDEKHKKAEYVVRDQPLAGSWLINDTKYVEWKAGQAPNRLLWLNGVPGAGKTVLSFTVIKDLQKGIGRRYVVIFFYCEFHDPTKRDPKNLLASLLGQLLLSARSLSPDSPAIRLLLERYQNIHSIVDFPLQDLILALSREFERVYVVIDGLDECENLGSLLPDLEKLSQQLHVFVTSRDQPIPNVFAQHHEVTIKPNHITDDVRRFAEKEVKNMAIGDPALARELVYKLVSGSEGTFLWPAFHLQQLRQLQTDDEIRESLNSMPEGMDNTFLRSLKSIDSRPTRDRLYRVLRLVVFATRPLKLAELAEAVATPEMRNEWVSSRMVNNTASLIAGCANLLVCSSESATVVPFHASVKEFLLANPIMMTGAQTGHLDSPSAVHNDIAKICLNYLKLRPMMDMEEALADLSLYPFADYAITGWLDHIRASKTDALASDFLEFLTPGSATLEKWNRLCHRPYLPLSLNSMHIAIKFDLPMMIRHFRRTELMPRDGNGDNMLFYAIEEGSLDVIKELLATANIIEDQECVNNAFLRCITCKTHPYSRRKEIVQVLLSAGADVKATDAGGLSALHLLSPSYEGQESVFKYLIAATYSSTEQSSDTLCVQATMQQTMLRKVSVRDSVVQGSVLYKCSLQDSTASDSVLIECSVHNSTAQNSALYKCSVHDSSLSHCALCYNSSVSASVLTYSDVYNCSVTAADSGPILYSNLANVALHNSLVHKSNIAGAVLYQCSVRKSNMGDVALHQSSIRGSDMGGALLYESSIRGSNLGNALLYESSMNESNMSNGVLSRSSIHKSNMTNVLAYQDSVYGQYTISNLVESDDTLGGGATLNRHALSELGELVQILLYHGAELHFANKSGDTPMHHAARQGYYTIVVSLLFRGHVIDSVNHAGHTPLHVVTDSEWSWRGDYKLTTQLLIDHGADLNACSLADGNTPLHLAARQCNTDAVALLLRKGANVNAVNDDGHAPIHFAFTRGWQSLDDFRATIERLLDSGANVNASILRGAKRLQTPLHLAASLKCDVPILGHLINKGADAKSADCRGRTPLHLAAKVAPTSDNYTAEGPEEHSWVACRQIVEFLLGLTELDGDDLDELRAVVDRAVRLAEEIHQDTEAVEPLSQETDGAEKRRPSTIWFAAVVELLSSQGVTVNERDEDGKNVLRYAMNCWASWMDGHHRVLRPRQAVLADLRRHPFWKHLSPRNGSDPTKDDSSEQKDTDTKDESDLREGEDAEPENGPHSDDEHSGDNIEPVSWDNNTNETSNPLNQENKSASDDSFSSLKSGCGRAESPDEEFWSIPTDAASERSDPDDEMSIDGTVSLEDAYREWTRIAEILRNWSPSSTIDNCLSSQA